MREYILALIIVAPSFLFILAMIDNMDLTNKNILLTQELEAERSTNNTYVQVYGSHVNKFKPISTYNKNGREDL